MSVPDTGHQADLRYSDEGLSVRQLIERLRSGSFRARCAARQMKFLTYHYHTQSRSSHCARSNDGFQVWWDEESWLVKWSFPHVIIISTVVHCTARELVIIHWYSCCERLDNVWKLINALAAKAFDRIEKKLMYWYVLYTSICSIAKSLWCAGLQATIVHVSTHGTRGLLRFEHSLTWLD